MAITFKGSHFPKSAILYCVGAELIMEFRKIWTSKGICRAEQHEMLAITVRKAKLGSILMNPAFRSVHNDVIINII